MKILLHICCAPCAIYPLKILRQRGHEIIGLFHNPNIHPYTEYKKRLDVMIKYADEEHLKLLWSNDYEIEEFFRETAYRERNRCIYCYYSRLKHAASVTRKGKFDGFTTTLLYSKFQNHDLIKKIGDDIGKQADISFYYYDFREGWKEGITESKKRNMYRQQYCGCIYSEKERFYKPTGRSLGE